MAIYVFSLLVGYVFSGVDSVQGNRNRYFKKTNHDVKYIFTQIPSKEYIQRYEEIGISREDMLSAHLFLLGKNNLAGSYPVEKKQEEFRRNYGNVRFEQKDKVINVYQDLSRIAQIELKEEAGYFDKINYYEKERLILSEYYADRLLFKDYYVTAHSANGAYAKLFKTSFINEDGQVAYECIYETDGKERYVYPNGMTYTKSQMLEDFVKNLKLTENDIVFIDRPSSLDYVQPLFQQAFNAKIIVFLHSGHYFEKGEDNNALYMNYECYYWFKYSQKIDTILVSTEEQRIDLREKLEEYHCEVPNIEVIPASGLECLKYASSNRKKGSMLTVSRLDDRKKIHWIIESVMEAHKHNPEINLDIYGTGNEQYVNFLKECVSSNQADDYIHFMGHCDVSEVYKNYEVYISASLWETLGLSVMEAVGSGNAIIGLDTHYGNRLFIHHNENGQLIDFDISYLNDEEKIAETIKKMSEAILYVFDKETKIEQYRDCSYEIAKQFLNENIERKWLDFFNHKNV